MKETSSCLLKKQLVSLSELGLPCFKEEDAHYVDSQMVCQTYQASWCRANEPHVMPKEEGIRDSRQSMRDLLKFCAEGKIVTGHLADLMT